MISQIINRICLLINSITNNTNKKIMSSLIIKLIPLEQQVFGNNLISKRELKRLKNKHKEELNINEEDMLLIKEFLENFENK